MLKKGGRINLPLSFFLGLLLLASVFESVTAAEEPDSPFDIVRIIQTSPPISGTVQASWQRLARGLNAYQAEAAADFYAVFRLSADSTRLHRDRPGLGELDALDRIIAALHLPLEKFSIVTGMGWEWYRGKESHSGPATLFLLRFKPSARAAFEMTSGYSFSDGRLNTLTGLGILAGAERLKVRLGYRWLSVAGETFNGPSLGFVIQL